MSTQVATAFAQKFHGDFILLSQQKQARLRPFVRDDPDSLDGKFGHFNRIGATSMVKNTSRHGDTPLISTPHSRRRISMDDWDWADLIDRKDLHRMISNPQSSYHRNAVMAANRNLDDVILAAANGNAVSMDEDEASSNVALPAAQIIGASGAGLTLAKLIQTQEKFNAAEVDEDEELVFALGSKQITDTLNITEFKSNDFNGGKPLMEGKVVRFMGFNFVRSERLTKSGSDRQCLAWARSGMGFATGEELFVDIGPRRDKRMSVQVYVAQTMGATRIEDEKVVQIDCQES